MSSALELELRGLEDPGDMFFPKLSRFGMALESMKNREYEGSIQLNIEAMFVPIGICIVDRDKCRCLGWRRVGICILGIATIDLVVFPSCKGKEKALHRLFDAG